MIGPVALQIENKNQTAQLSSDIVFDYRYVVLNLYGSQK